VFRQEEAYRRGDLGNNQKLWMRRNKRTFRLK
jgi:hypothetical protein